MSEPLSFKRGDLVRFCNDLEQVNPKAYSDAKIIGLLDHVGKIIAVPDGEIGASTPLHVYYKHVDRVFYVHAHLLTLMTDSNKIEPVLGPVEQDVAKFRRSIAAIWDEKGGMFIR